MFNEQELVTYTYNDFEQLKTLINVYLENEDGRKKIQLAGHRRTKAAHTYTLRLQQILNTLNLK